MAPDSTAAILGGLMAVRGVSQAAVARHIKRPKQTFSRWMNGAPIPVAELRKILDYLAADDATRLRCLRVAA